MRIQVDPDPQHCKKCYIIFSCSVADLHHFDADSETYHFDADLESDFYFIIVQSLIQLGSNTAQFFVFSASYVTKVCTIHV
jgi:hypothetical protein